MNLELCRECNEPTGHAGREEDSLYCEYCEAGPFCHACFETHKMQPPCIWEYQFDETQ